MVSKVSAFDGKIEQAATAAAPGRDPKVPTVLNLPNCSTDTRIVRTIAPAEIRIHEILPKKIPRTSKEVVNVFGKK
jgi:hypothetical protein